MAVPRFIWISIGLWASSCVLEREGSFEPTSTGAGAAAPDCKADDECGGTVCRPSRCDDGSCIDEVAPEGTACTDDEGTMCDGMGRCLRENGALCGSGTDCLSGHCADGVCCDDGCAATCESCVVAGSEGSCTPFEPGSDPELDCGEGGVCDGSSGCASGAALGSLSFGDNFDQLGNAVAVDASGNRLMTASFVNSITFDTTLVGSPSNGDIAVAKISPAGTALWSRHFPGTGNDVAVSIAVTASGYVFVGGQFDAQLVVGTNPLTTAGLADMFVAKLDSGGTPLWSRSFGSAGIDVISEVHVKDNGNLVLSGWVSGPVSFDGGVSTLPFAGGRDIVVAELAGTDGALVWAESMGGGLGDEARGLAVDDDDNVFVSGVFAGSAAFGASVLTAAGDDAFLAKLDADGEYEWVVQIGGSAYEVGRALQPAGNDVVLAGEFTGSMTIGGTEWTSADGSNDVFIARFDENGEALWARALAGSDTQFAHEIGVDASGNVVLVGAMRGSASIDAVTLTSAGLLDVYMLKLAFDGTALWGERFGDDQDQSSDGVTLDARGNAIAVGWFRGGIDFGDTPLTSAGGIDVFLTARTP